MSQDTVTFEVVVERHDSKWVPFRYRMSWCKQKEYDLRDWVQDNVNLMGVLGGPPGQEKMQVGDKWQFRVTATITSWQDYWGEFDQAMEIHSSRCFKKYRRLHERRS